MRRDFLCGAGRRCLLASRTDAPINDLGLVDNESTTVRGFQARRRPHGTVGVDGDAAAATDEVMVVVVDSVLVPSRRTGRLNPPDEALLGQRPKSVVDSLVRHSADLRSHGLLNLIRGGVWTTGQHTEDSQALSRHLRTVLSEQLSWIHRRPFIQNHTLSLILDTVKPSAKGVERAERGCLANVSGADR